MAATHEKIAIVQSNFLPWKGYFDIVAVADELILYDEMRFTKNDWRNRNKIKTPQGVSSLTVPVGQSIDRRIRDIGLPRTDWRIKHWKTLQGNYARALHFDEVASWLEPIYLAQTHSSLSELNRTLIDGLSGISCLRHNMLRRRTYATQTENAAGDPRRAA